MERAARERELKIFGLTDIEHQHVAVKGKRHRILSREPISRLKRHDEDEKERTTTTKKRRRRRKRRRRSKAFDSDEGCGTRKSKNE